MHMPLPESLLASLRPVQGFREEAFVAAHSSGPPSVSVRLHPVKQNQAFDGCREVPWCTAGKYLEVRPRFTLDPLHHAGTYYVQEASSMFTDYLVRHLLPQREDLRVLDLCAAPGGKTTLLAAALPRSSLLISNEVIRTRATVLEENAMRWGYTNNWVSCNDPAAFESLPGYFDLVLVDAPCSGSGLFRKDPEALKSWRPELVALCAGRQQRIVNTAWKCLKPGGWLLYATCSYSPEENEGILDFLADRFSIHQDLSVPLPEEWGIVETVSPKHQMKGYRFFPDRVLGEGFFISAMQKTDGDVFTKSHRARFKTGHEEALAQAAAPFLAFDRNEVVHLSGKPSAFCVFREHEPDLHYLQSRLYFRKQGLPTGVLKQKEWIPDHAVALSVDGAGAVPALPLERENALRFLSKQLLSGTLPEKGWYRVTHEGHGLGWVKSLGNRLNNYLPTSWRIRMEIPS